MEQQQAKEALEKEKQNQIINGKTYLQTLALQQREKKAAQIKEKEEDKVFLKLQSQRYHKEEKSRQDHFDRLNSLQLMSEEKTKRIGKKMITKSIDELSKLDEQQFIKVSFEK